MTREYLADTGVFYRLAGRRCSSNVSTVGLRATAEVPLEIVLGAFQDPESFSSRRAAASTFLDVCGFDGLYWPLSSVRVASAFGIRREPHPRSIVETLVACFVQADSAAGVALPPDYPISLHAIVAEDRDVGPAFVEAVCSGNRFHRNRLVQRALSQGHTPRDAKKIAREKALAHAHSEDAWVAALVGLACQAGLFSPEELDRAAVGEQAHRTALGSLARARYDGSLDFYVKAYLAYHKLVDGGRTPGRNDRLDLEQLMAMRDDDSSQVFVTTDSMLVDVVSLVDPARVVAYKDWIAGASQRADAGGSGPVGRRNVLTHLRASSPGYSTKVEE